MRASLAGRLRCESDSHSQQQQEPPPRRNDDEDACKVRAYGDIPNQAEAVTASSATLPQPEYKATPDIEYLQVGPVQAMLRLLLACFASVGD